MRLNVGNVVRFARYADGALAIVSLLAAIYFAAEQNWGASALFLTGSLISTVCFRWPPANWVASHFLSSKQ